MKAYIDIFRTLLAIDNKKKKYIIIMFLTSLLNNIFSLLSPIAASGIVAMVTTKNVSGMFGYALLCVAFYVGYFFSLKYVYKCYTILSDYYQLGIQKRLLEKIAVNERILEISSKGKILGTCSDDVRYLVDVLYNFSESIVNLLKLGVIFIIFVYNDVYIALFVVVLNLLYLKLMNDNSKNVSKYYEGTRKYEDKIVDRLNQMMTNPIQIKTMNMMPKLNKNLDIVRDKWKNQYELKRKYISDRYTLIPYIIYIGKVVLYLVLGFLVIHGTFTIDKWVLLVSYYEMTMSCGDVLFTRLLDLGTYGVRVSRIKAILDYVPEREIEFGELENDYITGSIEFKNVFYQIRNKKILNGITFKLYPNEINTIIGHKGSGKTTIIKLLYRLDRVKSGEILIDKENIYNYSKNVYFSNVSGVFQKPFVFDMSIKDNLSLIDPDIKNQIAACKRVGIHDYIISLPRGYNTIIGEEETLFPDGKKQMLSIAMALLTKAEILLFDEVTSNIDPESTADIINIMNDLKMDHTVVVITHKPEVMDISDRIIVLSEGKVVAKGKNGDVYNKSELYRELKNRTFASVSRLEY